MSLKEKQMAYCRGEVYIYKSFDGFYNVHFGHTLQAQGFKDTYFATKEDLLNFLQQEALKDYARDAIERLQRELGETNGNKD